MIARIQGTLLLAAPDRVEVETASGVVYEIDVPLTVHERLPPVGSPVSLRTHQIVTETSITLCGFLDEIERALFRRLLTASGVGARLALAMMSTYPAERLARALVEKDVTALRQVTGIGKKTAEKIVLELADRVKDLAIVTPSGSTGAPGSGAGEAVRALVALGYSHAAADEAVRAVLAEGVPESTDALVRRALAAR